MAKTITIKLGDTKEVAELIRTLLLDYGYLDLGVTITQSMTFGQGDNHFTLYGPGEQIRHGKDVWRPEEGEVLDARTQLGEIVKKLGKKSMGVKLNDQYHATVSEDRKTVTVGCQTFDAAKVLEIARIIEGE